MTDLEVRPEELQPLAALFGLRDPYPEYAKWRARQSVVRPHEKLFVFSSYEDCAAVLSSAAFGHAPREASPLRGLWRGTGRPAPAAPDPAGAAPETASAADADAAVVTAQDNASNMLRLNPPDHTRLRRMVSRALTPASVRALMPRIEAIAGELVGGLGPSFDIIRDVALPLPVQVISELLGIPEADRPMVVTWSEQLSRSIDPGFLITPEDRVTLRAARDSFHDYLGALIPKRRREPGEDLVSALVHVHDEDGTLTEHEIVITCRLLLIAGHETTRSVIGGSVLALLNHPTQFAALRADPDLIERCVEEAVRYDPPIQLLVRSALEDTTVGDTTVPAGARALMLLGAANRDEALGDDPEDFDFVRPARRHLSFGHGIHFCLGAPLGRAEAAIALRHLLPVLAESRMAEPPVWKPHTVLRGLESLRLTRSG
jgi:cytochrome P450